MIVNGAGLLERDLATRVLPKILPLPEDTRSGCALLLAWGWELAQDLTRYRAEGGLSGLRICPAVRVGNGEFLRPLLGLGVCGQQRIWCPIEEVPLGSLLTHRSYTQERGLFGGPWLAIAVHTAEKLHLLHDLSPAALLRVL